jgi:DNA-binding SARP family transcriptional activator
MFTTVSLEEVLRNKETIYTLFKAYNLEIPLLAIERGDRVELAINALPSLSEAAQICTYLTDKLKTKVDLLEIDEYLKTISLEAPESKLKSFFRVKDLKNVEFKTKELVFHDQFSIKAAQEKIDAHKSSSTEASSKKSNLSRK